MPTDTARGPTDAVRFVLRGVAWSLGFFGLLRLSWIEAHVVLPFTRAQARCGGGTVRRAGAARRGHAGVQRRRRAGPVPRGRPRLSGAGGERAWPAPAAAPP